MTHGAWRDALAELRRRAHHPPLVTAATVAGVLFVAGRLQTYRHELPLDVAFRYGFSGRALSMGHWSTLWTSQFLSRNLFMVVSIALSLALMLGLYEAIAGSARALVVTAVTGAAGPLLVAAGLGLGSALGNEFAGRTLSTLDYGMSAVTAGAGGALVAVIGGRKVRIVALVWVIGGLLLHHQLADWEHLVSFTAGFGIGCALGVPRERLHLTWPHGALRARAALAVTVGGTVGALAAGAAVPAPAMFIPVVARTRPGATIPPPTLLSPPTVVAVTYPSPALGRDRTALVVLPPGYEQGHRHYPVVELLHGYPGGPGDIINGLDPVGAEELPGMPPFIAVAPDGRGPAVADSWFADTARQHVGTAVSDDLVAFVTGHFRTNGQWSVGGLSAGGYGAAYLGARSPQQYQAVCSLSGVFIPDSPAFAGTSRASLLAGSPMSHATPFGPRTLLVVGASDRMSLRETYQYAVRLGQAGEPHQVLVVRGGHDWDLWRNALPACLRYMLGAP